MPLDGRLKKIRDSQSIGVAYRADAIPFSFEDSNKQVVGYTVDLCRRVIGALEKQLGVQELKIRWVPVTAQNRFGTVAKAQADLECGSSTVTLGRMKEVDFPASRSSTAPPCWSRRASPRMGSATSAAGRLA